MKTLPKQLTRLSRPRKIDERYTVNPEFSGRRVKSHVTRFCGDWIGQALTRAEGIAIARNHRAAFIRQNLRP